MASDSMSGSSHALLDMCFSLEDGLKRGMRYFSRCQDVEYGQDSIVDHEDPLLLVNPSSISRLCIERGEYPAVNILFKYLSGVVNDHFNWVNHELSDLETQRILDKAGVLSAVLLSGLCNVNKDLVLLRHIVRRWSSETHTFVCLWGEFTPTLEDVANIMGLPIVGTLDPSKIQVSLEDVEKLCILKDAKDRFASWVKHFWGYKEDGDKGTFKKGPGYDSGCRLEALLSLWLSKFMFSDGKDTIQERVFPLALLMCKGESFPLAPMFLGYLYQSLDSIVTQEKEGAGRKIIDSCASTTFLQMFLWERLKDPSIKPNTLVAFKKKELIGFSPACIPLMYRWFKKVTPRDVSTFLDCLDDEEKFKFRPYADLMEELPLKSLYDECKDSSSTIELPVKCHDNTATLDAYLIMRCGMLPTFSASLDEKTKISLVIYSPHRVRRQFGLDQRVPLEQNNDGCDSIQLFYGNLEILNESIFVTMPGRERFCYKSKAFHDFWLGVLHGFKNYVEPGGHDSRVQTLKSNDGVRLLSDDSEVRGKSDGRGSIIEGKDCGVRDMVAEKKSEKCGKRKVRPKVLGETFSKKRVNDLQQGREKSNAIGSSISLILDKRVLRPREPSQTIPSSDDDEEDSLPFDDTNPGQSGRAGPHKRKDKHVEMSPNHSTDSSKGEKERIGSENVDTQFIQPILGQREKESGFGLGSSSSGVPKTPLFTVPKFPAKKFAEVPPQIKDFVYWGARFEGTKRVIDSIEKLHPLTYSDDNLFPFHDMYACPEVIAPLTKFFEKYGDMSQIDRFKYCMCDTKSTIFERLGFVLLSMEKTSTMHLSLDEILAWRDVVRDLICLGVPIGFLLDHLQKLVRVCYFLRYGLSKNVVEHMGEIRLLEDSAEDIYKKVRAAQTRLRDLLSCEPDFPIEYSDFILESASGIGCSALLGLYDCRP